MSEDFQARVELEMAYEPYSSQTACLDLAIMTDGDTRECRRSKNHAEDHASGFGAGFRSWKKDEEKSIEGVYTYMFERYN